MSTPTPGASDAPTTPPASSAEANRPPAATDPTCATHLALLPASMQKWADAFAESSAAPGSHPPGSLPWEAAERELAQSLGSGSTAEVVRRACEQWAAIAHASWSKHLADYRAHHLAETCRLQAMLSERTAQLAQARAVIEECRPMVKARICMPPAGVDESVLGRIEQALSGAPAADTGGKEATL